MHSQTRQLNDVTSRHTNSGTRKPSAPRQKKTKSFALSTTKHDDNLSNPFKTALNITSSNPTQGKSIDASEDDDIKKSLSFNSPKRVVHHATPTHTRSSSNSIPCTPSTKPLAASFSISPSPGVVRSKQNIPSPQRIPSISLRSFHTLNHIEFYKPIPINQSRSTQFEILNETYDHKAVQLKQMQMNANDMSCITITPTAINLKRNQRCLITVTCQPRYAMRIKEVINIEWDLHSIQLHIHAVGFSKSMRTRQRKRSLKKMRKEDEDKCNSVESSLESSLSSSSSNSTQNSVRKARRRHNSRRPRLSPTIRREKAFTAAPFSSPAPFKMRPNFMFHKKANQATQPIGFTPKGLKKRRMINPINEEKEEFERLCNAVQPIQAVFRSYIAHKQMKQLLDKRKRQTHRQQYYIDVIRSQLIMKRVHSKYTKYKHAVRVLECAMRTYVRHKQCTQYIRQVQHNHAACRIQSWFRSSMCRRIYKQHVQQIAMEIQRQRIHVLQTNATLYIQKWFRGNMYRKGYRLHQRLRRRHAAAAYIQSWFKGLMMHRMYNDHRRQERRKQAIEMERQRQIRHHVLQANATLYIQKWFRGTMYRNGYRLHQRLRRRHAAAVYIQSWFKGVMTRMMYNEHRRQERRRQAIEMERQRQIRHLAVVCIQSWFRTAVWRRGFLVYVKEQREEERRIRMENAAVFIQSWFKGVMYRRNYRTHLWYKQKEELRQRQQNYMCCLRKCRRIRMEYLNVRQSCVVLQSVFKTYAVRKKYTKIRDQTVFIQCFIRGKWWRNQYLNVLREKEEEKRRCVLGVLSLWRLHQFHHIIREKHRQMVMYDGAATYIQSWFRGVMFEKGYLAHMRQKRERMRLEGAALCIQSWFRGVREYRVYLSDDCVSKVILMQAWIRGKLRRIECRNDCSLMRIIDRVNAAHKGWHRSKTVNYLLDNALNKLMGSRTLYGVSEGCDTLEALLRVVPNVSNRIVEHNIIGALYNVLRNSNRSEPHLYLVNKILHFMLLFAQHDRQCYSHIFYREDTLEILSERLQIHRLDFVLFELTTQLFFVGVDVEDKKFLIDLRQSNVNRQIRTVQKIMASKLEIAKRVNRPLKKLNNANARYKIKFEQEKVLSQCVRNMNKLVDKL